MIAGIGRSVGMSLRCSTVTVLVLLVTRTEGRYPRACLRRLGALCPSRNAHTCRRAPFKKRQTFNERAVPLSTRHSVRLGPLESDPPQSARRGGSLRVNGREWVQSAMPHWQAHSGWLLALRAAVACAYASLSGHWHPSRPLAGQARQGHPRPEGVLPSPARPEGTLGSSRRFPPTWHAPRRACPGHWHRSAPCSRRVSAAAPRPRQWHRKAGCRVMAGLHSAAR